MYKNSLVHNITKIVIDLFFLIAVIACPFIPLFAKWWDGYYEYPQNALIFLIIILIMSCLCCIYILWQLKIIFKTMIKENPFIEKNAVCLNRIAAASFLVAAVYLVKCFLYFSITTLVIVVIFIIAALFCLTLKDVFRQAIAYKEENDWTV